MDPLHSRRVHLSSPSNPSGQSGVVTGLEGDSELDDSDEDPLSYSPVVSRTNIMIVGLLTRVTECLRSVLQHQSKPVGLLYESNPVCTEGSITSRLTMSHRCTEFNFFFVLRTTKK
jgi:hypothetical protein